MVGMDPGTFVAGCGLSLYDELRNFSVGCLLRSRKSIHNRMDVSANHGGYHGILRNLWDSLSRGYTQGLVTNP